MTFRQIDTIVMIVQSASTPSANDFDITGLEARLGALKRGPRALRDALQPVG